MYGPRITTHRMEMLFDDEELSDIQFCVGSEEKMFYGIRSMFASATDSLRVLLCGRFAEAQNGVIALPETEPIAFDCVKRLVYGLKFTHLLEETNVFHVLRSMDMWGLTEGVKECQRFVTTLINPSNALKFLFKMKIPGDAKWKFCACDDV